MLKFLLAVAVAVSMLAPQDARAQVLERFGDWEITKNPQGLIAAMSYSRVPRSSKISPESNRSIVLVVWNATQREYHVSFVSPRGCTRWNENAYGNGFRLGNITVNFDKGGWKNMPVELKESHGHPIPIIAYSEDKESVILKMIKKNECPVWMQNGIFRGFSVTIFSDRFHEGIS